MKKTPHGYSILGERRDVPGVGPAYTVRGTVGKRSVAQSLPLNIFDAMTDAQKLAWLRDKRDWIHRRLASKK